MNKFSRPNSPLKSKFLFPPLFPHVHQHFVGSSWTSFPSSCQVWLKSIQCISHSKLKIEPTGWRHNFRGGGNHWFIHPLRLREILALTPKSLPHIFGFALFHLYMHHVPDCSCKNIYHTEQHKGKLLNCMNRIKRVRVFVKEKKVYSINVSYGFSVTSEECDPWKVSYSEW